MYPSHCVPNSPNIRGNIWHFVDSWIPLSTVELLGSVAFMAIGVPWTWRHQNGFFHMPLFSELSPMAPHSHMGCLRICILSTCNPIEAFTAWMVGLQTLLNYLILQQEYAVTGPIMSHPMVNSVLLFPYTNSVVATLGPQTFPCNDRAWSHRPSSMNPAHGWRRSWKTRQVAAQQIFPSNT